MHVCRADRARKPGGDVDWRALGEGRQREAPGPAGPRPAAATAASHFPARPRRADKQVTTDRDDWYAPSVDIGRGCVFPPWESKPHCMIGTPAFCCRVLVGTAVHVLTHTLRMKQLALCFLGPSGQPKLTAVITSSATTHRGALGCSGTSRIQVVGGSYDITLWITRAFILTCINRVCM